MAKRLTPRGQAAPPPAPNVAAAAITKKAAKSSTPAPRVKSGTKYIRNIRHIQVRVTLDTGRRIELTPRGSIEDLAPVTKEEQEDAKFLGNIGHLYEVITAAQAKEIIAKQSINAQAERPNHWAELLRGPTGGEYNPEDIGMGQASGVNDIRVGTIEPASNTNHTERNTEIRRPDAAPTRVAAPGSIDNPLPTIPSDISAEEVREFLAWREAREAQLLRESLSVTVEPVQREE